MKKRHNYGGGKISEQEESPTRDVHLTYRTKNHGEEEAKKKLQQHENA